MNQFKSSQSILLFKSSNEILTKLEWFSLLKPVLARDLNQVQTVLRFDEDLPHRANKAGDKLFSGR